jgi:hypothetical protein
MWGKEFGVIRHIDLADFTDSPRLRLADSGVSSDIHGLVKHPNDLDPLVAAAVEDQVSIDL